MRERKQKGSLIFSVAECYSKQKDMDEKFTKRYESYKNSLAALLEARGRDFDDNVEKLLCEPNHIFPR